VRAPLGGESDAYAAGARQRRSWTGRNEGVYCDLRRGIRNTRDADAERIESLARQIDSAYGAIAEVNPRLSTHQVAVLSALNLMGELVISERRYNELLNLLEQV